MSQEPTQPAAPIPPPAPPNPWQQPQVVIALITGIVTVIAAFIGIIPALIPAAAPTPTPPPTLTPTVIAAVAAAPSATPTADSVPAANSVPVMVLEATTTPLPAFGDPTNAPDAPPTPAIQSNPPNALLIYDGVAFTLVNASGGTLSLAGVRFTSASGGFEASTWANASRIPDGNCVRLRDAAAGRRNPPPECRSLLSLMEVGNAALFWLKASTFEVLQNGAVIASCATDTDRCAIHIPQ
jgi:hypothetical protein